MSGAATEDVYLAKARGRRIVHKPVPFERPEVAQAEGKVRAALHGAFLKLRPKVAAHVRRELGRLRKAAYDDEDELWVLAGEITAKLELDGLSFVIDDVASALDVVAASAAQMTLGTIGVDDSAIVDQIDTAAADWAKERAAELVGKRIDADGNVVEAARAEMRIDESTRDMIRQTIYDGLNDGLRSSEIADEIEIGSADAGYAFSEERAALIANTEIRRAHSEGSLAGMRGAQDAGVDVRKRWITSGHDTACDDCLENEAAGEIDIEDEFPSGDDAAPAHPNCNCDIVAIAGKAEGDDGDDEEEKAARTEASLRKAAHVGTERLLGLARDRLAEETAKLAAAASREAEANLRLAEKSAVLAEREATIAKAEVALAEERSARAEAERRLADRAVVTDVVVKQGEAMSAAIAGSIEKLASATMKVVERKETRTETMSIKRLGDGTYEVVRKETTA